MICNDDRTLDKIAEDDKAVCDLVDNRGDIRVVQLAILQGPNKLANGMVLAAFGELMAKLHGYFLILK